MFALIQASRLASLPLAPIVGKPLIEHQIDSLLKGGIERVFVSLSKEQKDVAEFLKTLNKPISVIIEPRPLGTGGALFYLYKEGANGCIYVPGNVFFDISWKRYLGFYEKREPTICPLAHPLPHIEKEDAYLVTSTGKVLVVLPKDKERDFYYDNLGGSGIAIVSQELLETFDGMSSPMKMDFYEELLLPCVACEGAYAYTTPEYVKTIKNEADIAIIEKDEKACIPRLKNLENPQKAIFLDRDGTINVFGDYVRKSDMLELIPSAGEAIRLINESPYLALLATNQPIVARGDTTMEELANIHRRMEGLLAAEGAYLDAIYCCPHHPHPNTQTQVAEYVMECDCRKPKIGMLLHAKEDFNLDLSSCWFVGDTLKDCYTGKRAGCKSILVLSGDPRPDKSHADTKPDYVCQDILEAVKIILGHSA